MTPSKTPGAAASARQGPTAASTWALDAQGITVDYGKVRALSDANVQVPTGQIVTVIGPNGAGKTTLLHALMGVLPSEGRVMLGQEPVRASIEQRVAQGMCLVPEKRELFASMSVQDNLLLGAYVHLGAWGQGQSQAQAAQAEVYQIFPRLQERRLQLAGTLSGGERQMLAIGRALMSKPRLLLLDEPSLGLAPLVVKEIFRIIARLRDSGVAILLVEQNARAALQVANWGYVLETGRITMNGPASELMHDPRVAATYLGLG
jgi:branched-chain amino acid transport system ATP-binding protein